MFDDGGSCRNRARWRCSGAGTISLILTLVCFVAVEESQRRTAARFQTERLFQVKALGQVASFRVFDISVSGIAFYGRCAAPLNTSVMVVIGMVPIAGVIVRASDYLLPRSASITPRRRTRI